MAIAKEQIAALTLDRLHRLLDPARVYYRPVVFDILKRADPAELKALSVGVRELKEEYGDFDGLLKAVEGAGRKAQA